MKCKILHELKGRIRVHLMQKYMTLHQADMLEYYLKNIEGISSVSVYDRTCDAVITYNCSRSVIISALSSFAYTEENELLVPENTSRAMEREFEDRLSNEIIKRYMGKLLVPAPIRNIIYAARAAAYVYKGIKCLIKGKIQVPVLDATAISVSVLRSDYKTAASVMFLLKVGEILEEWTHKKSVASLADTMSLNVEMVWKKTEGAEVLAPIGSVSAGDLIVVRTGGLIPLDGKVEDGEIMVNQSSMTGESLPVRKHSGSYVYAGTAVEEGECTIRVEKDMGCGRYDRIVQMIERSEKLKSETEDRASHLADRLVPYSLGGTVLTYFLTRNVTKALSILMVDFSCALKLAMPIAVLSAMRECSSHHISVKGGKFMEAVAEADTIVFDKTGTLTNAEPRVERIVTFNGTDNSEMLCLAACLEEHYPHSIANAVVAETARQGLSHEEKHTKVEYVVAHGISSRVDNKKVVIGSYHFVFEDEKCVIPKGETKKFDALPNEFSHLYLAIDGVLSAVICIEDPLKSEAKDVINQLHNMGINKIVMMTGDNARTAKTIAKMVGIDEYYAEVLPEEKAEFIKNEHNNGRKVIMVGDGINDSLALSESDAGIAINSGAAIAREISDITISEDSLYALVTLKDICSRLMERINNNYRFIILFNMILIGLGIAGVLPPATSALLHNASTVTIAIKSTTNLLEKEGLKFER